MLLSKDWKNWRKKININEATDLLKRTYKVLLCIENLILSEEVSTLTDEIEKFLNGVGDYEEIDETKFEQLDSRLQVVETFLDSVQSVGTNKKQLS